MRTKNLRLGCDRVPRHSGRRYNAGRCRERGTPSPRPCSHGDPVSTLRSRSLTAGSPPGSTLRRH